MSREVSEGSANRTLTTEVSNPVVINGEFFWVETPVFGSDSHGGIGSKWTEFTGMPIGLASSHWAGVRLVSTDTCAKRRSV
ncbi:hypothetical protein [Solemya velum gill symbiont]|uniref:hypothetical protein n=1 Tax=Solemya velum gill symbiont TaxID=2340 RepID=UPI00117B7A0B|nr:hypothetical protein [Solemya velum gill symbiont]